VKGERGQLEGVVVRSIDDSVEVYGFPRRTGPWFGEGDGRVVLRENGRGEGVGLRGREDGGVGGAGKVSGPDVCRHTKQAEGKCLSVVVLYSARSVGDSGGSGECAGAIREKLRCDQVLAGAGVATILAALVRVVGRRDL